MLRQGPIKVLIVDDSAMVRTTLKKVLSSYDDLTVIGEASSPFEARELIITHRPDVIILDIEMPRMDGITFLKKLMIHYPVPVIMCSAATPNTSRRAVEAVAAGAVDIISKPQQGGRIAMRALGETLVHKIRVAYVARPHTPEIPASALRQPSTFHQAGLDPHDYLVVIGASTGGTEATKKLLENVPADFPATVIVQHMPEGFTESYANRLNDYSAMSVCETADGDVLTPGKALVARGDIQLRVKQEAGKLKVRNGDRTLINRHCPSVDVMFQSCLTLDHVQIVGIILTGMGNDGAKGLEDLHDAGAITFGQNKESCIVYGMPCEAYKRGAVDIEARPEQIPALVMRKLCARQRNRPHRNKQQHALRSR